MSQYYLNFTKIFTEIDVLNVDLLMDATDGVAWPLSYDELNRTKSDVSFLHCVFN